MILQAAARRTACARCWCIAAALSIPDPRERPADREDAARQKHARFADEHSDFVSFLNLWRYLREQRAGALGQPVPPHVPRGVPALPAHPRVAGPRRPAAQRSPAASASSRATSRRRPTASTPRCWPACSATSGCARATAREYVGARNSRFVLAPGSVLTKRPPRWIVVADLVETSRLYGRIARAHRPRVGRAGRRAPRPAHLQRAALGRAARRGDGLRAGHAVRPAAGRPAPRRVRGRRARARRASCSSGTRSSRATGRPGTTSSATTRRCAPSSRRWRSGPGAATCSSTDDELYAFYDARVPADGRVAAALRRLVEEGAAQDPGPADPDPRRPAARRRATTTPTSPTSWRAGDLALPVSYRFEPGADDDGVTVHVPVDVLARLGGDEFAWQVPALREELVTALIRSLPKDLRRNFVPVPDTARAVLAALTPGQEPLLDGRPARAAPAHRRARPARRVRPATGCRPTCG